MNDSHPHRIHSTGDQIVPGTLADGGKPGSPIDPGQRSLRRPNRCGHRPGRLRKGRAAEQMGDDGTDRSTTADGEEERQLVDVFDHDVGALRGNRSTGGATPGQGETVPATV